MGHRLLGPKSKRIPCPNSWKSADWCWFAFRIQRRNRKTAELIVIVDVVLRRKNEEFFPVTASNVLLANGEDYAPVQQPVPENGATRDRWIKTAGQGWSREMRKIGPIMKVSNSSEFQTLSRAYAIGCR